jgi:predicted AlkP superfamily pyrophosphatase or phosphodiesterase
MSKVIRVLTLLLLAGVVACGAEAPKRRIVILKIDGLNADLLYHNMREKDPATGKPRLPWFSNIFAQNGTVFENFYVRGISLSAPAVVHVGHGPSHRCSR